MKSKKMASLLLASSLLISLTALPVMSVSAEVTPNSAATSSSSQNASSKQFRTLKRSYVVYGAGAEDKSELASVLGVNNDFETLTAGADDYQKYIDPDGSTTNAAMVSSVSIVPTDPGSGVQVNVKQFGGKNNITKVTSQQYAMVAQMAGVTDVTITVSANRPVSGESALTGVYEAINADGVSLDPQNTQSANQMLGATNGAINANDDDKSYPGKLMAAVGDTTKDINQQRKAGQTPSEGQISNDLNRNLDKRGIKDETAGHTQPIINALVQFSNSPISVSGDYSSHVNDTISNVKNSAGNMMNRAKQFMNSPKGQEIQQQGQGIWQRIVNWFHATFG